MKKKILFVHLCSPTYTQIADELENPNHDQYGLADGEESSPTVTDKLLRGARKLDVYASMSLPLGISYLSGILKKKFPDNLEQYLADYVEDQKSIKEHKTVDEWILAVAKKKNGGDT